MDLSILSVCLIGAVAGLIGAMAMNAFMRLVSFRFSQRVDMTIAVGSLLTGRVDNARMIGTLIHAGSGVIFGAVYLLLFSLTGLVRLPEILMLGLGIGFVHGLVVSYGLMFVVSERHPVEQFRTATIEIGLIHLVGHVLFGLTVGLAGWLGAVLVN
jgi:hypothetical protein